MKVLTNYDFNGNEIQNVSLQKLASAPSSPVKGQAYFNTTDSRAYIWNGSAWKGMDSDDAAMTGADIVAAINESSATIDDNNLSSGMQSAAADAHTHDNKALLDTYTQTNANVADAVTKKHAQNTDTGTSNPTFTVGNSGVKLKNNGGTELQVRNSADTDFADLRVKNLTVDGATTVINSNEVDIGDNEIVLNADVAASSANSDGGIAVKRLMADNTTRKDAELVFNNSTGRWQTTGGDVSGTLITAQIANKVTAVIGDGTSTAITVAHNLNTRELSVSLHETASPYAMVMTDVEFTTLNSITLKFAVAPTSGQYTVTVIG